MLISKQATNRTKTGASCSEKLRQQSYGKVPHALWKRVEIALIDVGPGTFQEKSSAPYVFHELLVNDDNFALLYGDAKSRDTFMTFRFRGDPTERFDVFFDTLFDAIMSDGSASGDFA